MTLKQYFKRALSLPPHILILKVYQHLIFRLKSYFVQIKDIILPTSSSNYSNVDFTSLFSNAPDTKLIKTSFPQLDGILKKTTNHEFNLLGSNWVKVEYGMDVNGIMGIKYDMQTKFPPRPSNFEWIRKSINFANRTNSNKIWKFISKEYNPIDWHIDFKSGYRWNPKIWWFRIPYGHRDGVDIKVPWELSRCQHFPWLALAYGKTLKDNNKQKAETLAIEFQNQILDFIATNPPKFGVNWRCPMDVAIRAANWVYAYDIFRLYGWEPSQEVKNILANSLYDHGVFIYSNLEIGTDKFRGNHYLADICGLAFIAAFLPKSPTTNYWLNFSFKALKEEMDYQFFDDGSNFEGSTAYHRLSAEMMLYTSLLFDNLALDKKEVIGDISFDEKYLQKLYLMSQFSQDITRQDGNICQIGDNDSGRFIKIQPDFISNTLEENHLSQSNLINIIQAFFKISKSCLNSDWIYRNTKQNIPLQKNEEYHQIDNLLSFKNLFSEEIFKYIKVVIEQSHLSSAPKDFSSTDYEFELSCKSDLEIKQYQKFGLYIFKNKDFFLSFRCGKVGQKERGGHDHNDQLSIEIFSDTLKIEDPGTGLYTPFPEIRNKYRSISSHFGPQVYKDKKLIEPGKLDQGLFSLNSKQSSEVIYFNKKVCIGYNRKLQTIRFLIVHEKKILIRDLSINKSYKIQLFTFNDNLKLSRGYGLFINSNTNNS
ncbi:heparinase II/III family protein [Halobacteriovorax sp. JY17]|uniref:heparinase II/III family protein n=1 Tax=Halobacteriovorax sp. JY17 TaxID=2014617 RepID=UPI000C57BFD9|nr:heparinase II/III family protein [Halobacteriovorax sp. JY17]PIK14685.1 MAG: hypothetical protein CES88_10125 [Halobacteriovorax sp. JY17]